MKRRLTFWVIAFVGLGSLSCTGSRVVVGSKNFTEQVILGEMLALMLEERGLSVERRLNLGGSFICHQALESGQMDVYVEYTGTAWMAILKEPILLDSAEMYRKVQEEYRKRFQLAWGEPLGFNNTYALAMRPDHAASLGIRRISDLADHVDVIRTGFGHEFLEREDGFRGFTDAYGLQFVIPPAGMDLGLIYQALMAQEVDLVAGSATDALIEKFELAVLEDDLPYFPPYDAAPVYRPAAIKEHPALGEVLRQLADQIDERTIRRLNLVVDVERRPEREVARGFLVEMGWISQ